MKMKDFTNAMLGSAAATLGALLVTKGVESLSDPIRRANMKKRIKNIKNVITNKAGS